MTVAREISLKEFDFWSGAKATANMLTEEEFELIEEYMQAICDIWTDTEVNDFFWFDDAVIADLLGYDSFDDMWKERANR